MTNVLYAIIVLGVMGAAFGLALAVASKVFAVEVDPREEAISGVLPGANCGGCGYPGCGGYASAVVAGEAPVNKCAAGGADVAAQIAAIMGVEAGNSERMVAQVMCSGGNGNVVKKYQYSGVTDCAAANLLSGKGENACAHACLGLGSCVKACAFDAIHVVNGAAVVDHEKCVGCMSCAAVCPKHVIAEVPYAAQVTVPCSSKDKGAATRKACAVGCIGCKLCERTCESDAIHVVDNCAVIDYAKCTNCGACAEKCPRKIIVNNGKVVVEQAAG